MQRQSGLHKDAVLSPQEQQRQRPHLFHKLRSDPPGTARTRDNLSMGLFFFAKMPG